jgi:FkbM family methyltransferase
VRRSPALVARVAFRRLWTVQPLNALATHAVRGALEALGREIGRSRSYLPHAGTVRSELPNGRTLTMWSRGDDEVANIVFWHGWDGYEPAMSSLFYRLAASAAVTIDIGAHTGYYSVLAALANPDSKVFALEPNPTVFARLGRNLGINGAANVQAYRLAAGERAGHARLFEPVSSALTTMSTLSGDVARHAERFGGRAHRYGLRSFDVAVQPMDEFVEEHGIGRVDLLKADTEGTEDEVLRGMRSTLERDRPEIFCEVLSAEKGAAIQELLEPLGYQLLSLAEDGPQRQDTVRPMKGKTDYLFTTGDRASSPLARDIRAPTSSS